MSSEPAWSSGGGPAPYTASDAPSSSSTGPIESGDPNQKMFMAASAIVNIGLSIMISANGAIAMKNADGSAGVGFVGFYMMLFAIILFGFEATQITKNAVVDLFYKKNFGFLYGNLGKAWYLLFVGILCFGITDPSWTIATGVLTIIWAILFGCFFLYKPELYYKYEKYSPNY